MEIRVSPGEDVKGEHDRDAQSGDSDQPLPLLLYSTSAQVREQVRQALGTRLHRKLPPLSYVECATAPAAIRLIEQGDIGLAVLDGEATPTGGMGLAKQLRDEVDPCPPILVLIGREDDRWLAKWSRADAVATQPIDPIALSETVTALLLERAAAHT